MRLSSLGMRLEPVHPVTAELPLILYDSEFGDVMWERDDASYMRVVSPFQQLWTMQAIKSVPM